MQNESILIHEFGHVIQGVGFNKEQQEELNAAFAKSRLETYGMMVERTKISAC